MSSPRGRGLRPGGVVRAIGRLVVLVCAGFALGLIFGVVTEEPELLAAHLRGQSESVVLEGVVENPEVDRSDATSDAHAKGLAPGELSQGRMKSDEAIATINEPLPSVASQPARVPASAVVAARSVSSAAKDSRPPEIAVSTKIDVPESARAVARSTMAWSIQIGAFSDQVAAEQLAETLRDRYPVEVLRPGGEGGRFRVRVQPIDGERLAREIAEELKRDERLPTWVTPVEGASGS